MLTREDDIDVHALRRQGWTISAIARHLGRDSKTIRAYLAGREAGTRVRASSDSFQEFAAYAGQRLADDPHLWASTLFEELTDLGYDRSYPSMTRALRARGLRPACEPCAPTKGRPVAVIDHPPGEETQWDWVELPDPPEHWGWGKTAHLLVGALSHSGRWRGVLCEFEDQAHLVEGLDRVAHALGGLTRDWRFDRMATVISPETGRVSASFSAIAKHYGVSVRPCPPRRGNRKGVVEKANHTAAQRFWRTLPDDVTVEEAQARLETWCATRGDIRLRATADGRSSVAVLAAAEPLAPVPTPFPAVVSVNRVVSAQALVSFRGNRYSVPPHLHGATLTVHARLGGTHLDIATAPEPVHGHGSPIPTVVARHRLAPTGAGATIRDDGHVTALTTAVLAAFTTQPPHTGAKNADHSPPPPAPRPTASAPATAATTAAAAATARWWSTSPATQPRPADATPSPHPTTWPPTRRRRPISNDRHEIDPPSPDRQHPTDRPGQPTAGGEHGRPSQPLPAAAGPPGGPETRRRRRAPTCRPGRCSRGRTSA